MFWKTFGLLLAAVSLTAAPYKIQNKSDKRLPITFLQKLKKDFEVDTFIETGTYKGDTALQAARVFTRVHTIELLPENYRSAKKRLKPHHHVNCIEGDSARILQNYRKYSPTRAVLWLDAHNSGEGTTGLPGIKVIVKELQALKDNRVDDAIILVDDLRCMYYPDERQNEPQLAIKELVESLPGNYCFYALGDIGFGFNREHYPDIKVSKLVKAITISRFFDRENGDVEKVMRAEKFIMNSFATKEGLELKKLFRAHNDGRNREGGGSIYVLWDALQMVGAGDTKHAVYKLHALANSRKSEHWRIWAHLANAYEALGSHSSAEEIRSTKIPKRA